MIKSWPKLIFSIFIAQFAGLVGTIFTFNAISTWYATLTRPAFAPPNWVFGPVWTILYTLIGISLYKIWIKNKKDSLKLFFFHLFLNAIWSPIFFGLHDLALAFLVIVIMDITLIFVIKNFYKLNRIAGLILIPYLLWIGFATILNFSFWQLNKDNLNIFAQDFTFTKAREDYIFTEDNYKKDLSDLNLKKASYQKNPTLSLKEELRVSLYKFVGSRNNLIKNYLTMLRMKELESVNLRIDPEVVWYETRKKSYSENDSLEDIIKKSKEEDEHYETNTLLAIYFALSNISLDQVKTTKEDHLKLYKNLKNESQELIKLGRADTNLFDRWFRDIDQELDNINLIEKDTLIQIDKIFGSDDYQRNSAYKKAIETLEPAKINLLKLNGFIKELENIIASKR